MSFNKIPLIGNEHSEETRNIINLMVQIINNRGIEILSDSAFLTWLDENGVKHQGEWDNAKEYDRLSVVLHEGSSYTSKKQVPVGIDILNEEFWVLTGNYNAQIDHYQQQTTQKLSAIGVNPIDFGAKFDGINDDTNALIDALEYASVNGNSQLILTGIILVNKMIEIPEGVTVHSYNATIKPIYNTNVLSFNRDTKIKGNLTIDVSGHGELYNQSVLYFNGEKRLSYRDIILDSVFILGYTPSGMGNAVHFDCTTSLSDVAFVQFNNLVIRGFEKGIFFDVPEISGSTNYNYANGNIFNSTIISDCDYYIYGTGGHENNRNQASGNWFGNVQLQYNNRAKEFIHLEGRSNVFKGYIWDAAFKDVTIINLTSTSMNNNIEINGSNDPDIMYDNGRDNTINKLDDFYDKVPFKNPVSIGDWSTRFEGDYDDVLNKSDIFHNTSVITGGDNIILNDLSQVFDAEGSRYLGLNLSNQGQFKFEIDFNGKIYNGNSTDYIQNGLKNIGLVFGNDRIPENIIIEVESNTGKVSTTNLDMTKKGNRPYIFIKRNTTNGLNVHISKIRVTLIGQVNSDVRLARMVASSFYMNGNVYVSTAGGKITGELDVMNMGQFKLPAQTSQPSNHEVYHRRMLIVDTPDGEKVMICLKQTDGSYQFVPLN